MNSELRIHILFILNSPMVIFYPRFGTFKCSYAVFNLSVKDPGLSYCLISSLSLLIAVVLQASSSKLSSIEIKIQLSQETSNELKERSS